MTKNKFIKQLTILTVSLLLGKALNAQMKVGDNPTLINANSALEIESTNKGVLLPRLSLTSTTSFAPLSAHIAGMVVYNMATTGDVSPGYFFNDGSKWVKIAGTSGTSTGAQNTTGGPLITISNGAGATLTAMSVAVDTNALKTLIANNLKNSPIKDSLTTIITNQISSGNITGQNLTNSNGIIVTGGTGTSLKATSLRLDSTAVAKMINQSPTKDSVGTAVTNIISSGGITGQNLTNSNGIIVTGGTGTSLKSTSLRLDSTAVAKMISQSPTKDSVTSVVNNVINSGTGITGKTTTAGSLVTVTNGAGAALKDNTVAVDTTALKTFISNTATSGAITGQNLTAGSLLQTTGTPTGASLKTAGYAVDTTALKGFVAGRLNSSPIKDSLTTVINNQITGGGITGQNLTNSNGIIVTGGTGTSLKSTSLRLDSTAVAKMISQSPAKDSVTSVVNNVINSGTGITGKTTTAGSLVTVTNGAGAALKDNTVAVDTTALKTFISNTINNGGITGKNTTAGSLVTVSNGTGASLTAMTVAVDTTALKSFVSGRTSVSVSAPLTGNGTTASPLAITQNTTTAGQLITISNGTNATFTAMNVAVDTTALKTFINGRTTNTLTAASNAITSTTNGVAATLTPAAGTLTTKFLGFDASGNLVTDTALTVIPATTNLLTNPTNTITSTVNGVVATAPAVNTVSNSSAVNTLSTTVNGVIGAGVNIINNLAMSNPTSNTIRTTVNGVVTPTDATIIATNTLTNPTNTITSTVNGVAATTAAVNTVSNNFNTTTRELTTTVNGVAGTAVTIPHGPDSTTASNGLTMTGKDIRLGGTLTAPTTITTSATNTLSLTGLPVGTSADSLLTANTAGAVRKIAFTSPKLAVVTTTSAAFTIPDSANVVIYTGTASATFTLPAASAHYGRELRILNYAAAVGNTQISLSTPIIVEGSTTPVTDTRINSKSSTYSFPAGISSQVMNTVTLISNGSNWYKLGN